MSGSATSWPTYFDVRLLRTPRVLKRAGDIFVASILLLVTGPLMILLAIVSTAYYRSWPIFVQSRAGWHGNIFMFPKIRTLPIDAPRAVDKYAIADEVSIPRFFQLMRRTHLDELPQLLLVLLGRMTLVGPRPELPKIIKRYPKGFATERTSVKPGCTGLWQISVEHTRMIFEAQEYDEFYVANVNFKLDLWILWRTVLTSVSHRFEVSLDEVPNWAISATAMRELITPAGDSTRPQTVRHAKVAYPALHEIIDLTARPAPSKRVTQPRHDRRPVASGRPDLR